MERRILLGGQRVWLIGIFLGKRKLGGEMGAALVQSIGLLVAWRGRGIGSKNVGDRGNIQCEN